MTMQTDVKSAHTNVNAALYVGRTRLKGVVFTVSGGSPVDHIMFYDNASAASGTVRLELDSAHSGSLNVVIPGEGILFTNGIYCDVGDAASVTIFYG
jgi:autotransporter adhesin